MMNSLMRVALAGLAACALLACSRGPQVVAATPNDPHGVLQAELEKGNPDLNNLTVVRLQADGKRMEVTSVLPAVVAEAVVAGVSAKTIFRLNDKTDGLVLFSRDILNGKSSKVDLPFAELETRKGFTFPVVQPDGSLKEQSFTLEKVLRPTL